MSTAGQLGIETGRSPCGERGLKFLRRWGTPQYCASLPVRGAWIEISASATAFFVPVVAPRAGSVD
mgnify:CR=1 FL=1